jgi:hypothetical protein
MVDDFFRVTRVLIMNNFFKMLSEVLPTPQRSDIYARTRTFVEVPFELEGYSTSFETPAKEKKKMLACGKERT